MSILVTGASGGFGKVFLPLLKTHYDEEIIGSGRAPTIAADYVRCDFSDEPSVRNLIKSVKPRLVFNLVGSFTGQFEQDFNINTLTAKYLFDSILAEQLSTRVIIFGSAAEYGAVLRSDNPIPEDFPCRPVSVYGLTKVFQTDIAGYYARTKKMDVVVARVFNLATSGLTQRLFFGKAEALIASYKRGEISRIEFGNLDSERDYIELDQAAEQLLAIAEHGISGEIYNVGSGVPRKMRSILRDMLAKAGVSEWPVVESSPEVTAGRGFDVPIIYADISKVTELMNSL